jgi:thymidylate synthase
MSNPEEQQYLDLLARILREGSQRQDRTGVGTLGLFGTQLRFSLANNVVPMLTTKKMFTRGVIHELLFFLRGETDTTKLEAENINIWKGNTTREFLDTRGLHELSVGDMGKSYGFQWRSFGGKITSNKYNGNKRSPMNRYAEGVDQIAESLHLLKTDPYSRRIIVSAWNPKQLLEMALPPCHWAFQLYVANGKLSLQWHQRSVDTFLGLPFNILSYAILARLFAKAAGLEPGELIFVGGDTHIYLNHLEQVREQISREPYPFPAMTINKDILTVEDMENLSFEDFQFHGYRSHTAIKAEMAV